MPIRSQFETEEEWIAHLRMWFAGQALAAMSAELKRNEEYGTAMHGLASKAYVIADAMLRARESQS